MYSQMSRLNIDHLNYIYFFSPANLYSPMCAMIQHNIMHHHLTTLHLKNVLYIIKLVFRLSHKSYANEFSLVCIIMCCLNVLTTLTYLRTTHIRMELSSKYSFIGLYVSKMKCFRIIYHIT
jgi:hypothetical protein